MKHFFLLIAISCFFSSFSFCQQTANWSSYYENGFIWNPALTARWNYSELSATHRQEWSGFKDAPEYSSLGFQFPFMRIKTRVAVGGFIERDKVGPYARVSGAFTYSYRFAPKLFGTSKMDQLRIGVGVRFSQYRYDPSVLNVYDDRFNLSQITDSSISNEAGRNVGANLTAGIYYTNIAEEDNFNNHYFVGVALSQILPFRSNANIQLLPHASLHFGYRFVPFRSRTYYEPNVMISYSLEGIVNVMANVRMETKEKFWFSAGMVTNGDVFGQAGLIFSEDSFLNRFVKGGNLRIGMKADYNLVGLRNYAGIGYEAFIGYSKDI